MVQAWEVLLLLGAGIGAGTAVFGLLWWLMRPRVEDMIERVCVTAVSRAITDHERRITALENSVSTAQHPTTLVELAQLLDVVNRHAPIPPRETDPS